MLMLYPWHSQQALCFHVFIPVPCLAARLILALHKAVDGLTVPASSRQRTQGAD